MYMRHIMQPDRDWSEIDELLREDDEPETPAPSPGLTSEEGVTRGLVADQLSYPPERK